MTRVYNSTGKVRDHYVNKFMVEQPGITEGEATELYKQMMRERGSQGGKNSTSRPFRDVPGLGQKAGRLSRKRK